MAGKPGKISERMRSRCGWWMWRSGDWEWWEHTGDNWRNGMIQNEREERKKDAENFGSVYSNVEYSNAK